MRDFGIGDYSFYDWHTTRTYHLPHGVEFFMLRDKDCDSYLAYVFQVSDLTWSRPEQIVWPLGYAVNLQSQVGGFTCWEEYPEGFAAMVCSERAFDDLTDTWFPPEEDGWWYGLTQEQVRRRSTEMCANDYKRILDGMGR